jgi:periplasmic divalent cation tolerance protein
MIPTSSAVKSASPADRARGSCAPAALQWAMTDVLVVLSTFPSAEKATEVGTILVDERLAACVSVAQGVTSIYRWQGGVAREVEVLALIKTTRDRFAALADRLAALHPYELPEIVALETADGSASYLDWVRAETQAGS